MAQNKPELRKLTKNESELRRKEYERRNRQWYIDTIVQFKVYQARLIAILKLNNKDKTFPDTDPQSIVSPWVPTTKIDIAEMDTQLHSITPYHGHQKPFITTTYPVVVRPTPITGDDVSEITQGKQPNKPTTSSQYEYSSIYRIRQDLVTRCQEAIRKHYQEQLHIQHPEEAFFQDPACMPHTIKMTLLSKMALEPLEQGKYFPGTGIPGTGIVGVLVEADSTLGNQIICE